MPTPTYLNLNLGFTIAAGASLGPYTASWSVGPNHGPVIFTANPKPHQSQEVRLVTFDVAKCRSANGPVFYQFWIRNESAIDAVFDLELVWGIHNDSPGSPEAPW